VNCGKSPASWVLQAITGSKSPALRGASSSMGYAGHRKLGDVLDQTFPSCSSSAA
jgi:hypothetical protein